MKPSETIKEKWRIPDGKVGERYVVIFRALKVVSST
jgi:hypothetical protein